MNDWVRIGTVDDVPLLEGRSVSVGDRRIAVFKLHDGTFSAIDAVCPHAGGPLADGIVADSCVTCPLHNRRFDLATGESDGIERVDVHEVDVRGGELWVRLAVAVPIAA
jgi:nitrite reductase (NADH) small subunit